MIFINILFAICFCGLLSFYVYIGHDLFKTPKRKSYNYKFITKPSWQEEAEPASKVFQTLEDAGIKINFLGREDAKEENDGTFEGNNEEIKVISM